MGPTVALYYKTYVQLGEDFPCPAMQGADMSLAISEFWPKRQKELAKVFQLRWFSGCTEVKKLKEALKSIVSLSANCGL